MTITYPAGILKNTATGRFHPIIFRPAPLPSGADVDEGMMRHKSLGHHTAGFDSEEAAVTYIAESEGCYFAGPMWAWDGAEVPAMVEWFKNPYEKSG